MAKDMHDDLPDCKGGEQEPHSGGATKEAPWYKRYPKDFRDGTRKLSIAARGAYNDIIDEIYINGGPIPDKSLWMASMLHITQRQWLKLRSELEGARKISVRDGMISNYRAEIEIEERSRALSRTRKSAKSATKSRPNLLPKVGPPNDLFSNDINGGSPPLSRARPTSEFRVQNTEGKEDTSSNPIKVGVVAGETTTLAWGLTLKELREVLYEVAGPALSRAHHGLEMVNSFPTGWFNAGCDLQLDVLPVVQALSAKSVKTRGAGRVTTWNFYTNAIAEARDARLSVKGPSAEVVNLAAEAEAKAKERERRRRAFDEAYAEADRINRAEEAARCRA